MNFILFFGSVFIALKTSKIPLYFLENNDFFVKIFSQFFNGNEELFSISASIIAAYIFYFINIYLPSYIRRKQSLEFIDTQITNIVYRTLFAIYIYKNCTNILSEKTIKSTYSLISHDIEKSMDTIFKFSEYLSIEERKSISLLFSYRSKFIMNHNKLDEIVKILHKNIINLTKSFNLPSTHLEDTEWYIIKNEDIFFIKTSYIFKYSLAQLYELYPDEVKKLSDFQLMIDEVLKQKANKT